MFRIEIIKFSDYITLKQKEYTMLKEVPNIKTNPITYNLSYGMPPIGKDSLVDEKFLEWLNDQYESGIWDSKEKEKVSDLKKMNKKQCGGGMKCGGSFRDGGHIVSGKFLRQGPIR